MMFRMLLGAPNRLEPIRQFHDIKLWSAIVGGPIAIIPLMGNGLALIHKRRPAFDPASLVGSITVPLSGKQHNLWGKHLFVKYKAGQLVDLTDKDVVRVKALLGEPLPIDLAEQLEKSLPGATEQEQSLPESPPSLPIEDPAESAAPPDTDPQSETPPPS